MTDETGPRLSGRQAQAARNDRLILESARAVFTADPGAPISAVAEHAGVGISALYRRYRSKEELLRQISMEGLQRYIDIVEEALAEPGDPWSALVTFMRRAVEANTSSLTVRLAGTFAPTEEMWRAADRAGGLTGELIERVKRAGALRPEIEVGDLSLILEQLASLEFRDPRRTDELRQRYLALSLDALHDTTAATLPGPPPAWEEISGRFSKK